MYRKPLPLFKLLTLIITYFYSETVSGQITKTEYNSIELVPERAIYLNSTTNIGASRSKILVPISLPNNTVEWYYSFTTSQAQNGSDHLKLALQVTTLLAGNPSSLLGISKNIKVPSGTASIDTYLMNHVQAQYFLNGYEFSYFSAFSTQNTKQAIVNVNLGNAQTVYLGLNNNHLLNGVHIDIAVVAVVKNEVYLDEWSQESTEKLSTLCIQELKQQSTGAHKVCDCMISELQNKYLPSAFSSFEEGELNNILNKQRDECFKTTNQPEVKSFYEQNIANQNIIKLLLNKADIYSQTNDPKKAINNYLEILSIHKKNQTLEIDLALVHSNLGWNYLLTNNLNSAKAHISESLCHNESKISWGNLGHYYTLKGNFYEAKKIYLRYPKREILYDGSTWKKMIGEDLRKFESLGMKNDTFDQVRQLLKIKDK